MLKIGLLPLAHVFSFIRDKHLLNYKIVFIKNDYKNIIKYFFLSK